MIDGLIAGKLYGTAQARTGQSGKTFVTARVRAAAGDGESLFASVITFSDSTGGALLALEDGDAVSLAGILTPKVWTDEHGEVRPALDIVAHAVLTAYHMRRKRRAVQPDEPQLSGGGGRSVRARRHKAMAPPAHPDSPASHGTVIEQPIQPIGRRTTAGVAASSLVTKLLG